MTKRQIVMVPRYGLMPSNWLISSRTISGAKTSRRLIATKPIVAISTNRILCARRQKNERVSVTR